MPPPILPEWVIHRILLISKNRELVCCQLKANSYTINAGTSDYGSNRIDPDRKTRTVNRDIDIGAYEYKVKAIRKDAHISIVDHS
jgi:hypothetical protein